MKLWNSLKKKMLAHPAQTVCENDDEMSFASLVSSTEQFAAELSGIRCCAILCRSERMTARALLTCFAAGVTAVPLSRRYGELHCHKGYGCH